MPLMVYIWSNIAFYPALTPLALMPLLWVVRAVIRVREPQAKATKVMFVGVVAMAVLTYLNFSNGIQYYSDFLSRYGKESDGAITSVGPVQSTGSETTSDVFGILFRDENSRSFKFGYRKNQRRLVPPVKDELTPLLGEKIRVQYYSGVESSFLILSDATKSEYGARLHASITD